MNPVEVVVDSGSGLPPWRQVRDQLVRLITTGSLPAGTRLPTIRQLARDLDLAPGTIAHTYRELELAGLVRTGRARGTVVAETATINPMAALRELAHDYARAAHSLGIDPAAAIEAATDAVRASIR